MKGSAAVLILIIFIVVAVLGMVGFIFFKESSHPAASTNSTAVTPSIPVKDFAPSLPMSQKTTILIESSDSSEEKYIVPTSQIDTYVKSLPEGYHVLSKTP